ncbi:NADP-dependent oxidoreductase [Dinghuibacter silviterrae]|uniref:NADPH:quinone reductase-like Zn-dependent oxidoreductase n=1 Tax=Dinghuibacter silviterrae TaxID=1539049 RepID=A0A4R8DFG1_9BACT|nr:NADP-dependent oxidoreductase [Dinghuibacter silviterrae]TDW96167.1 NADPH:quinone reductase-like Zn-dependent oxidoreductase [Dinghuibacter silviterrae]
MKAIILTEPGGVDKLKVAEIPAPVPGDHEVLIQNKAISINPVDTFVRSRQQYVDYVLGEGAKEKPIILGWDVSGVVVDTGKAVTRFKKGDEVFGMVKFKGHGKAYAEYTTAPEDHLALKPANTTHEEAAAATLTALTAWQALVTYARIQKGDKVLIHAAAGGVGHYAVQIAKHFGAFVIGTGSPKNKEFVLGLGADQFIDYTTERFEVVVTDADIVLDSLDEPGRSLAALKKGGRLISILTQFDDALLEQARAKDVYTYRMSVYSDGEQMKAIAGLLAGGELRSHVSETYTFDQIAAAHQSVESGRTRGKIILKP